MWYIGAIYCHTGVCSGCATVWHLVGWEVLVTVALVILIPKHDWAAWALLAWVPVAIGVMARRGVRSHRVEPPDEQPPQARYSDRR
jgi:hypothetical protein